MSSRKNSMSLPILIVLVLVGVAIMALYSNRGDDPGVAMVDDSASASLNETVVDDMSVDSESMMKDEDDAMDKDMDPTSESMMDDETKVLSDTAMVGAYEEYDASKVSRAENGDVVIFFHATWCPSCRSLDKAIDADRDDIPGDVSILKVNYDTATDLRKKYGVTTQHTLVQVDADGNLIKKWSGSANLGMVLSQIQ